MSLTVTILSGLSKMATSEYIVCCAVAVATEAPVAAKVKCNGVLGGVLSTKFT